MIRRKWENELGKPEIYTEYEKERLRIQELGEIDFVDYYRKLANKKKGSTANVWNSAYQYLVTFTNDSLKFKSIDEKWAEEFKEYLLTTKSRKSAKTKLSQNSAASYFNKIREALKQAYRIDKIIQRNPNDFIEPITE